MPIDDPEAASRDELEPKSSYRRVLANRPFFLLWLGQLISQSGDYIFSVALVWLIYEITGSVFSVGILISVTLLPAVLVAPIAGVYVGKYNRRSILIVSNIFQAGIVTIIATLYVLHSVDYALLLMLVFLLGSGAQFVKSSVIAVVPSMVKTMT
ncbi:MAG: MFS transporter [Nitrososphaerales archaeon]